jgi:nucleoid-associated protein YejK
MPHELQTIDPPRISYATFRNFCKILDCVLDDAGANQEVRLGARQSVPRRFNIILPRSRRGIRLRFGQRVTTPFCFMKVKNFIIHAISKAQGANVVTLKTRDAALPLDAMTARFVETAFNLFNRQNKGLLFAGFDTGGAKEVFSNYLSGYRTQKKLNFVGFTVKNAQHLSDTMKPVNLATGGFLIFAEAEIDGEDRLCVLLLSQELKFAVDEENLTLLDVPALNLERMGVGCFISLDKWAKGELEPVAYVRGNRDVSEYFMRFIGASPAKAPKDASQEVAAYAENFLAEKNIQGPEQSERLKRMYDYCVKQYRANLPVELSVIGSIIYQEDQNAFCQKANADGISSEFHVDARHLKGLLLIEYTTK